MTPDCNTSEEFEFRPDPTSDCRAFALESLKNGYLFCLFVLRLNVPVNNNSVMSRRSQRFLGLTSTVWN